MFAVPAGFDERREPSPPSCPRCDSRATAGAGIAANQHLSPSQIAMTTNGLEETRLSFNRRFSDHERKFDFRSAREFTLIKANSPKLTLTNTRTTLNVTRNFGEGAPGQEPGAVGLHRAPASAMSASDANRSAESLLLTRLSSPAIPWSDTSRCSSTYQFRRAQASKRSSSHRSRKTTWGRHSSARAWSGQSDCRPRCRIAARAFAASLSNTGLA